MELWTRLMVFRAEVVLRRANRRRRRQLAAYSSQADLDDLYAVLNTYPDGQTHEIRQILSRQQAYRTWSASRTP
jgi:hypothetical protein